MKYNLQKLQEIYKNERKERMNINNFESSY